MEHPQYFEDYRIGDCRRTFGRTITENRYRRARWPFR